MRHTEIRDKFLNFFKSKGHTVIASDSLVPAGDPTLLFTSAGMNQFKEQFLGNIKGYTKAATCQKCLRTPDLENVGKTAYHHTFFEMLGNFSFGDYFKEDAIKWAWEFMKDCLSIPEDKLWVSVYEEDDEAYGIWKDKISVPEEKIIRLGQKENFWPSEAKTKGPNGPCGPCSEIFYDYGKKAGCGKDDCTPACDCGRFVEVWNLVFTQFERKEGGALEPLPNKNIDTGMGLERLSAVMQGVKSNFETDIFTPIIKAIMELRDNERLAELHDGDINKGKKSPLTPYVYAIADHIRAVTFAISDGVTPSNEERGYVIRNLLRRAYLYGGTIGIDTKPFLYKLVYAVGKTMEEPYPEIAKKHQTIAAVIKAEEERFAATLEEGRRLIQEVISKTKKSGKKNIAGEVVFELFDTHGVPLDLLKLRVAEEGLSIDEKRFNELMQAQREQSRKSSKMQGSVFVDSGINERTEFIGYEKTEAKAKVLRILTQGAKDIKEADEKNGNIEIILDKSVFYGESGGQVGDTGSITSAGLKAKVDNAIKLQDAILLDVKVSQGRIKVSDTVDTAIDEERRLKIAKNHTATHLLQAALRKILGEHVQQQGSLVAPDRLRFDFTHFKQVTQDELKRVEEAVNEYIKKGLPVGKKEMTIEDAKKEGALAFFGEKYEQKVRVVSTGDNSKELCGGTHLDNTSEIELFKIMKESSVASGIRRIEAVTSDVAREWIKEHEKLQKEKDDLLIKKEEKKQLAKNRLKDAESSVGNIIDAGEDIKGAKVMIAKIKGISPDGLKRISDLIKTRERSFGLFLISTLDDKLNLLLSISEDLIKKGLNSGKLIGDITKSFGGSGGGRPNMAQGAIKDLSKIDQVFKEAKSMLTKEIGK
ncbi:MAG: alanine--tRNA ligase [Candidatus Omnitrophica bacterium]|nr:alanine--tRNA ligase [Candidatus Omnitrophota bacterium]